MTENKIPLSVAIITKNEEQNLPDCLASVSFAGEIVVVDSHSSDRTREIANEFGCRVYVEEWKGYGPQKNFAVRQCQNDWVLVLDADERVPRETREEIINIITHPSDVQAYSFPRKNIFHGKWIKHAGWWPNETIRLVRKTSGSFQPKTHEQWVTQEKIQKLFAPLEHYSFQNYSEMLQVMDQMSSVLSRELWEQGKRVSWFTPYLHGIGSFLKIYLFKLGFLEGIDGLVIALTNAGGSFFKYAKLLEIQKSNNEK